MSDTRWCKSGSAPSTGQDRTGEVRTGQDTGEDRKEHRTGQDITEHRTEHRTGQVERTVLR